MKNFKRLVAGTIAATMALALSVSAFAETAKVTVADDKNSISLSHEEIIADTTTNQWTAVLINKDNESVTLTGDTILYINQGAEDSDGAGFWDSMGTKITLVDGETYILRLGGDAVSNGEKSYYEYEFTVGELDTRVKGDVIGSIKGEIDISDVGAVLQISLGVLADTWTDDQKAAADVVGTISGEVDISDVGAVLQKSLGLAVEFKD